MITAVTLSVDPLVTDDPAERAARQVRLQETEAAFDPLPFHAAAARAFGRLAAGLRRDFPGMSAVPLVAVPHPDAD